MILTFVTPWITADVSGFEGAAVPLAASRFGIADWQDASAMTAGDLLADGGAIRATVTEEQLAAVQADADFGQAAILAVE